MKLSIEFLLLPALYPPTPSCSPACHRFLKFSPTFLLLCSPLSLPKQANSFPPLEKDMGNPIVWGTPNLCFFRMDPFCTPWRWLIKKPSFHPHWPNSIIQERLDDSFSFSLRRWASFSCKREKESGKPAQFSWMGRGRGKSCGHTKLIIFINNNNNIAFLIIIVVTALHIY